MKKKFLSFLLLTVGLVMSSTAWALSGSGTEADPYLVTSASEMTEAIGNGGYIKLNGSATDMDFGQVSQASDKIYFNVTKEVSIDLNGHNLKVNAEYGSIGGCDDAKVFNVTSTGKLTLTGSGTYATYASNNNCGWNFYSNGGTITIDPGEGNTMYIIKSYVLYEGSSANFKLKGGFYGDDGGSAYNPNSGWYDTNNYGTKQVTANSKSWYTLYTLPDICTVNSVGYKNIAAAMEAAELGSPWYPIVLSANATYSSDIAKDYTFDGGDYTLTVNGWKTISAGTYNCKLNASSAYISGGTFNAAATAGQEIKGGTFSSTAALTTSSTISNGTFNCAVTTSGEINGGDFNETVTTTSRINGGDFAKTVTFNNSYYSVYGGTFHAEVTGANRIMNGTFEGAVGASVIQGGIYGSTVTCSDIQGGIFDQDPTSGLNSSYSAIHESSKYYVAKTSDVSSDKIIGGAYFNNVGPVVDGNCTLLTRTSSYASDKCYFVAPTANVQDGKVYKGVYSASEVDYFKASGYSYAGVQATGSTVTEYIVGKSVKVDNNKVISGTFDMDPSNYVDLTTHQVVESDNVWTVSLIAGKGQALIGTKEYEFLTDAFSAVQANETITLTADVTLTNNSNTYWFSLPAKTFTLDMNGHSIARLRTSGSNSSSTYIFYLYNSGVNMTITGAGTLKNEDSSNGYIAYLYYSGRTLTLQNCNDLYVSANASSVFYKYYGTLNIYGGNYNKSIASYLTSDYRETQKNGWYTPTTDPIAQVNGTGYLTLQKAMDASKAANYATITLLDNATYSGAISNSYVIDGSSYTLSGATIYNGTYTCQLSGCTIKGGTFAFDPTSLIDTENYQAKDNGNNTWTVSLISGKGAAKVITSAGNETEYLTMPEALTAWTANDGSTLKLQSDYTLTSTLETPAGMNLVLDLNGKTVGKSSGSVYINVKGTLTLQSSVDGGVLNPSLSIYGTANIVSGKFNGISPASTTAVLNIKGGEQASDQYINFSYGSTHCAVNISGGTVQSIYNAVLNITDGYFPTSVFSSCSGTITGGEFVTEPNSNLVPAGYVTYQMENEHYGIKKVAEACKIGETVYYYLADAISAAKENDEIVLLANNTETVTLPRGIKVNLSGFTCENLNVESSCILVSDNDYRYARLRTSADAGNVATTVINNVTYYYSTLQGATDAAAVNGIVELLSDNTEAICFPATVGLKIHLNSKSAATSTWTYSPACTGIVVDNDYVTATHRTSEGSVAEIGGAYYASFTDALADANKTSGATIKLLDNIDAGTTTQTMSTSDGNKVYSYVITKSMTIDGDGEYTIKNASGAKGRALFGISGNCENISVKFQNITLENNCPSDRYPSVVETRGNIAKVEFADATVNNAYSGNGAGLSIGGNQSTAADVVLTNTKIDVGNSGYPFKMHNPVNATVTGCKFNGYCSLYFKKQDNSAGAFGSKVYAKNCTFDSPNPHTSGSNDFGVFVFEVDNVDLTVEDCQINSNVESSAAQAVVQDQVFRSGGSTPAVPYTVTLKGGNSVIKGILLDEDYSYPGTINIEGGKYQLNNAKLVHATYGETSYDNDGFNVNVDFCKSASTHATINITGGEFNIEPANAVASRTKIVSNYVDEANGYRQLDNTAADKETYPYIVTVPQQTESPDTYSLTNETSEGTTTDPETSKTAETVANKAVQENTLANENVANYATDVKGGLKSDDAHAETYAAVASAKKTRVDVKLSSAVTSSTTNFATAGTTIVKKIEFDVKPVYIPINEDGTEGDPVTISNDDIDQTKGITFLLPVDKNVNAVAVHAYHINEGGTLDDLGYPAVQGDATNGKYIELTATTFSNYGYELTDNTVVTGTVYTYETQSGTADQTLAQFTTTRETYPNAVMIVEEKYKAFITEETPNVMVQYSNGYVCPNFVLTDLSKWGTGNKDANGLYDKAAQTGFFTPVEFTATKGSCTRTFYKGYNSVCYPFNIASNDFNTNEVLSFSSFDENAGKVYFEYANDGVSAGTPVIIKLSANNDVTVSWEEGRTIKNDTLTGYCYKGVFTATDAYQGTYYSVASDGAFKKLAKYLYPFRACFSLKGATDGKGGNSGNGDSVAPHLVIVGEENATALDEVSAAKVEKFMQNGKMMIRRNGHIYDAAGMLLK